MIQDFINDLKDKSDDYINIYLYLKTKGVLKNINDLNIEKENFYNLKNPYKKQILQLQLKLALVFLKKINDPFLIKNIDYDLYIYFN